MKKIEIKETVQNALSPVFVKLAIAKPSKRTKKAISKISRNIKSDLKKQTRKAIKQIKLSKNGKGTKSDIVAAK